MPPLHLTALHAVFILAMTSPIYGQDHHIGLRVQVADAQRTADRISRSVYPDLLKPFWESDEKAVLANNALMALTLISPLVADMAPEFRQLGHAGLDLGSGPDGPWWATRLVTPVQGSATMAALISKHDLKGVTATPPWTSAVQTQSGTAIQWLTHDDAMQTVLRSPNAPVPPEQIEMPHWDWRLAWNGPALVDILENHSLFEKGREELVLQSLQWLPAGEWMARITEHGLQETFRIRGPDLGAVAPLDKEIMRCFSEDQFLVIAAGLQMETIVIEGLTFLHESTGDPELAPNVINGKIAGSLDGDFEAETLWNGMNGTFALALSEGGESILPLPTLIIPRSPLSENFVGRLLERAYESPPIEGHRKPVILGTTGTHTFRGFKDNNYLVISADAKLFARLLIRSPSAEPLHGGAFLNTDAWAALAMDPGSMAMSSQPFVVPFMQQTGLPPMVALLFSPLVIPYSQMQTTQYLAHYADGHYHLKGQGTVGLMPLLLPAAVLGPAVAQGIQQSIEKTKKEIQQKEPGANDDAGLE